MTFVSYARADRMFADKLVDRLTALGFDLWLDILDIRKGSRWDDEVEKALLECSRMLLILSPDSVESQNVKDEMSVALQRGVQIIPILQRDCEIPFRIRRLQHIDFRSQFEERLSEVAAALKDSSERETLPAGSLAGPGLARLPAQAGETQRPVVGSRGRWLTGHKLVPAALLIMVGMWFLFSRPDPIPSAETRAGTASKANADPTAPAAHGQTGAANGIEEAAQTPIDEPLFVTVKDNPARIGSFGDQPMYGVIPADVRTSGSPGAGCTGFREWLKSNNGVDAGRSMLQLVVQGNTSKAVLLSEMRVRILKKLPLVVGILVSCPPAGEATFRGIEIDLDADPPRILYPSKGKDFGFTIQAAETETFNIVARAAKGTYQWDIQLDVVVAGKSRTYEISGPAGPFQTTAKRSADAWEWDYTGNWHASAASVRAGRPKIVPAGTPLPVLD